jgi:chemotaxis signal transduction protein
MTSQVLLTRLGSACFALDIESVDRIVLTPRVFPLVAVRPGFRGVFLHERAPLPFLEPATLLGEEPDISGGGALYTVVCHCRSGRLGVPVDQVLRIAAQARGAVHEAPGDSAGGAAWPRTFVFQETEYPLLDIDGLLMSLPR